MKNERVDVTDDIVVTSTDGRGGLIIKNRETDQQGTELQFGIFSAKLFLAIDRMPEASSAVRKGFILYILSFGGGS